MPATLELSDLKAAAAKLSLTDRLEVISFLDEVTPESDAAIRAEWLTVARQRFAELESGQVQGVPFEEVFADQSS